MTAGENKKMSRRAHLIEHHDQFLTPFDQLFDRVFHQAFPEIKKELGTDFFQKGSYPRVNVISKEDSLVVEAAVPGMKRKDIDVEVHNGVLTIRGSSNQIKEDDGKHLRREIKRSSFSRSFNLSDELNAEKISGSLEDGILKITIPRLEKIEKEADVRKINIS